jgi:CRISPR-associated protein Csd1
MSMLTELWQYARKHGLATDPGFLEKEAKWAIYVGSDGTFLGVVQLIDEKKGEQTKNRPRRSRKGAVESGHPKEGEEGEWPPRRFRKCPHLEQPELTRGSKDAKRKSQFLLDTAQVVALYDGRDDQGRPKEVPAKGERPAAEGIRDKHDYFVELLLRAAREIAEMRELVDERTPQLLRAAADCLKRCLPEIREQLAAQGAAKGDPVTLHVDDQFLVDSRDCQKWWSQFRRTLLEESKRRMLCFATGELTTPALTHPKIRRLSRVGGHASGSSLISFDEEAFCSGGLRQSENYSVSEKAAWAYRAALDRLLCDDQDDILRPRRPLAGNMVAYWYAGVKPGSSDDLIKRLLGDDLPEETKEVDALHRARQLHEAIRTGQRRDLLGARYFAITLSGNRGRAVVCDWMTGSFEGLARSVQAWFEDLRIQRVDGSEARDPKFADVLASLLPPQRRRQGRFDSLRRAQRRGEDRSDELPAPLAAQLWHAAVCNAPIPRSTLVAALHSVKTAALAGEAVRAEAVGLLKAYHLRKARLRRKEEEEMPEDLKPGLNPAHPHPAYHCGRLMAVYAALQERALGRVGAGVVQRYYAAASGTPALVLGRLARLSQAHLGKLESGLARWYEARLADIWSRIRDRLPRVLDVEEQSLFALGYYQELADLRSKKEEAPNPPSSPPAGETQAAETQPAGQN